MNTSELKNLIKNKSRAEQSRLMKDFYKGKKCVLFSCGPSLISREDYDRYVDGKDYYIATVKQAYYRFSDHVDFQFFNCNNFTKFKPKNEKTIFFACSEASEQQVRQMVWGDQEINVHDMLHPEYAGREERTLSRLMNFEDWKFSNEIRRPWGPGIVYETVLFHLLHMGFEEVIVNGWDLALPNNSGTGCGHFYNDPGEVGGLSFFKNKAEPPYMGELLSCIDSSWYFFQFLNKNSVKFSLLSNQSYLDEKIPRIEVQDIA